MAIFLYDSRDMKKIIFIIVGIITMIGLAQGSIFYWKNLRGVGPAVKSPPEDIGKVINTARMPLKLPDDFSISIFAKGLVAPRVMVYDPAGILLTSITNEGSVVALPDRNSDGVADEEVPVITGLNKPHGLAFQCEEECKLYIAESDKVAMYDYDKKNLKAANKKKIIALPDTEGHFTRTIMFVSTPQGEKLLISVGSSCNVCNEEDWRRASILIADPDGANLKTFASGLRNAVFMAAHPITGKLWVTEMGRDLIGDDIPPDEINIVEEGANYGWPECYGKNVLDTDFHKDDHIHIHGHCTEPFEIPSHIDIQAHSAPLGFAFFPKEGWPQEYWYNLLVAYHGSWNRRVPTGYKIVRYKLDAQGQYLGDDSAGSPQGEDFIVGWLTNEGAIGRPVDILIEPGGKMFISDDKAGAIYQVKYEKKF